MLLSVFDCLLLNSIKHPRHAIHVIQLIHQSDGSILPPSEAAQKTGQCESINAKAEMNYAQRCRPLLKGSQKHCIKRRTEVKAQQ